MDTDADADADAGVALVRQENLSEPGLWYGELVGTGSNGTKTFRGNRGDRRRMYHPRNGRCISHNTVEVALSCSTVIMGRPPHRSLGIGTHNNILYDLVVL